MILAICSAIIGAMAPITTASLLAESANLDRLLTAPNPAYKTIQASSYDRASVDPTKDTWFANADYGQYIRTETHQGRTEKVMADFKGPGALVRLWSANPMGTVRFYFDGEDQPRIEETMAKLLSGEVEPWKDPYSYNSTNGRNLYFPFPFAKSLKVTVEAVNDKENLGGLYYHLDSRIYSPGTDVKTFAKTDLDVQAMQMTAFALRPPSSPMQTVWNQKSVPAGNAWTMKYNASAPSAVKLWKVVVSAKDQAGAWDDPKRLHNILKHIEVRMVFDGQETVSVPLPDFFGSGIVPAEYKSLPAEITKDGEFTFRLPMPFRKTAELSLVNHNKFPVDIETRAEVDVSESPYHLHAQWTYFDGHSRPFKDMVFCDFSGKGRYVGTALHVQNTTTAWWGEGDEKVWVDDEAFPSWFGTGTEDYFGYAWSDPKLFMKPYHAQPRADGPGCGGQVANVRWHIMDDIPFTSHMKFELERWHWRDVECCFSGTSFWYAEPGSWKAPRVDPKNLDLLEFVIGKPVAGAIEGEGMKSTANGGTTEVQAFPELSNSAQLWWKDAKAGDVLTFEVPAAKAGKYAVSGNFCMARYYGIHEIKLNGQVLKTLDFFSTGLDWKVFDLGTAELPAGTVKLEVTSKGARPEAEQRNMFGLDYILLKPID